MKHLDAIVVLETMWGEPKDVAPGFFRINPNNFSGRRLYRLLGDKQFLVTNACRELVGSPTHHGTPDPVRLAYNLQRCSYDLLLVCGRVAWETYQKCCYVPKCRVVRMKHPAARTWSNEELDRWAMYLKDGYLLETSR